MSRAKDVIYDLLLAADGEDSREFYGHEGVTTNGDGEATAVIMNMETRERWRITVTTEASADV